MEKKNLNISVIKVLESEEKKYSAEKCSKT